MDNTNLRALVDSRTVLQKSRIAFNNRVGAVDRGTDTSSNGSRRLAERWAERFGELERQAEEDIIEMVKDEPIVERLTEIKGVGFMLAAKLISMIDITRADTVSALWRYAGYGLGEYWQDAEGKIVAPKQGYQWVKNGSDKKEKVFKVAKPNADWTLVTVKDRAIEKWMLPYNQRLKTTCYLIGTSFMRSNSPYRKVYDDARAYYDANRPDWKKGRRDNAAKRKMIKVFLSHLWLVWRQMEGLPIRSLYVEERLKHEHIIMPEEFGWTTTANGKKPMLDE